MRTKKKKRKFWASAGKKYNLKKIFSFLDESWLMINSEKCVPTLSTCQLFFYFTNITCWVHSQTPILVSIFNPPFPSEKKKLQKRKKCYLKLVRLRNFQTNKVKLINASKKGGKRSGNILPVLKQERGKNLLVSIIQYYIVKWWKFHSA